MIKFNNLVFSKVEPNINSLWLKPNNDNTTSILIYNGGWKSLGTVSGGTILEDVLLKVQQDLTPEEQDQVLENLGIKDAISVPENALLKTEQTLTEAEQQQVLQNLGISEGLFELGQIITGLQQDSLTKKEQVLTSEEKAQVQTNIGVKDVVDVVGVEEATIFTLEIGDDLYYRSRTSGNKLSNNYSFISTPIKLNTGDIVVGMMYGTEAMSLMSEIDSAGNFIKNIAQAPDSTGTTKNYIYYLAQKAMYVEFSGLKTSLGNKFVKISSKLTKSLAVPGGYNRALYEAAGAVYNVATGFYELNGLTDITEEQMANIYYSSVPYRDRADRSNAYRQNTSLRTILHDNYSTTFTSSSNGVDLLSAFYDCRNLETIQIAPSPNKTYPIFIKNASNTFSLCSKLKQIKDYITFEKDIKTFSGATNLQEVNIKGLINNISFADSPLLSKTSILYMIQNSAATSSITITLHADAYAMAMEDPEIQAALEEKTYVSLASA